MLCRDVHLVSTAVQKNKGDVDSGQDDGDREGLQAEQSTEGSQGPGMF